MGRVARIVNGVVATGIGLLLMGASTLTCLLPWPPSVGTLETHKSQGGELIVQIERYKAFHGRSPESLGEAGISAPTTRHGPWRYDRRSAGRFILEVGDYGKYLFVIRWDSKNGRWYTDT